MGQGLAQGVDGDIWPPSGDQANTVTTGKLSAIGPGIARTFYGAFNIDFWGSVNTTLTTTAGSSAATVASATGLAVGSTVNSVNVPPGTVIGVLAGTNATLAFPTISLPCSYVAGYAALSNLPVTSGLVGATVTGPGIPANTTVVAVLTAAGPNKFGGFTYGSVSLSAAATLSSAEIGTPQGGYGANKVLFALTASGVLAGADAAALFTGAAVTYSATITLERSFDGGSTWITCNIGGAGTLASWGAGTPVSFIAGECERGVGYRLNCTAYTSGTINYRMSTSGQAALSLSLNATV